MGKSYISGFHKLYSDYKRRCAARSIRFDLSKDVFFEIVNSPCHYCGDSFTNRTVHRQPKGGSQSVFLSVGIDRVDNSVGYIEGNCVPCCKTCNRIKSDFDIDFLKAHLVKMLGGLSDS